MAWHVDPNADARCDCVFHRGTVWRIPDQERLVEGVGVVDVFVHDVRHYVVLVS